jgi:hypothetical protein
MSNISPRDRNWDRSGQILVDAATYAGIDPSVMIKIAGFESSFNESARPVSRNAPANRVRNSRPGSPPSRNSTARSTWSTGA